MDYTRHPKQHHCDQGQLKRKSINSNEVALCKNKIDQALAVEFLFYRAIALESKLQSIVNNIISIQIIPK